MAASAIDVNNPADQSSFTVFARHIKGDTAYGIDGDIENALYSVSNPAWPNAAGIQATTVAATLPPVDNINTEAGGGLPTAAWTLVP